MRYFDSFGCLSIASSFIAARRSSIGVTSLVATTSSAAPSSVDTSSDHVGAASN